MIDSVVPHLNCGQGAGKILLSQERLTTLYCGMTYGSLLVVFEISTHAHEPIVISIDLIGNGSRGF